MVRTLHNFCVVCIVCFVSFSVLFVCICVLNYCHQVATQLQLNISYHIIYHIISYITSYNISYHIISLIIFCQVAFSATMKMEAAGSCESFQPVQQIAECHCHISQDANIHCYCTKNRSVFCSILHVTLSTDNADMR
jgi:hypothetical protein